MLAALLVVATVAFASRGYVRGASFVVLAADLKGSALTAAQLVSQEEIRESPARVPWREGELAGRWYVPASISRRPVLIVPGVHAGGIDEPRLIAFARDLAAMGHPAITVELPDLKRYSITTRTTDMIEDAGVWLAAHNRGSGDGRIGMMGISFAGGLSIVAASRPSLKDSVAFVMSFGGHGDLPRTLKYLCTGVLPNGERKPPHDYGVAIILLSVAPLVVPAEQVEPLRTAILTFLEASHVDMVDKPRAQQIFTHARELASKLGEPSRTLMQYVNDRDVVRLGPILTPHVEASGGDDALSPGRSAVPAFPVYLLHGSDDNVIPAVESTLLAETLRARGATVHQLSTPLITHAEVDRSAAARAFWDLTKFWGNLLSE